MASARIRVLVVDDHPVVRRGIEAIVDAVDDIEVVGEASSGAEALDQCRLCRPDVVLMALPLGGGDEACTTRQLRRHWPGISVVMMLGFPDVAVVKSALTLGAVGVLTKDAGDDDFVAAIRLAHSGKAVLSSTARDLVAGVVAPAAELTRREYDVLSLVATGCTNADIATSLRISVSTVNFHVHNILVKLAVSRRGDAVAVARSRGLFAS